MKEDKKYDLRPSLINLCNSLNEALKKHLRDSSIYKNNVAEVVKAKDYRPVILLEDASEQGVYVEELDMSRKRLITFDAI